jgi:hypothetical protein
MSEIIEIVGRGFLALTKWIFIYGFIETFLYGCGYLTLKVFSFGKFPASKQHNKNVCIGTGLIVLFVVIASISFFNAHHSLPLGAGTPTALRSSPVCFALGQ